MPNVATPPGLAEPRPAAERAGADLLAQVGESPGLPTPPPVALDVIQKASQPDCEMEDIARIITLDPGLCGQVLRAVNSAMFGLAASHRLDRARPATSSG